MNIKAIKNIIKTTGYDFLVTVILHPTTCGRIHFDFLIFIRISYRWLDREFTEPTDLRDFRITTHLDTMLYRKHFDCTKYISNYRSLKSRMSMRTLKWFSIKTWMHHKIRNLNHLIFFKQFKLNFSTRLHRVRSHVALSKSLFFYPSFAQMQVFA